MIFRPGCFIHNKVLWQQLLGSVLQQGGADLDSKRDAAALAFMLLTLLGAKRGLYWRLRQARDAARIRDFILEHRPHVILVGGANLNCRQLLAELIVIRDNILETQPKFFTTRWGQDVPR